MVYTKDLKYLRQFGSRGYGPGEFGSSKSGDYASIHDVAADKNGSLYVSDYGKRCVHVFTKSGEFQYSLSRDKEGKGIFKSPNGISVRGQYVYVVDDRRHCVSVFTTEREHVASFGHQQLGTPGSEEGQFKEPKRVCVDNNGFVYVCDFGNNRVQIF